MRLAYPAMVIVWAVWLWLNLSNGLADQRGWGVALSTFVLFVLLTRLSLRGEGIARVFTVLLGFGYLSHSIGDTLYQTYPPGDTLGFADAWYYTANGLFIAAGVNGLLFIRQLTSKAATPHFFFALGFGLLVALLYHLGFGQATLSATTTSVERFTYVLDVLLITMSGITGYLFVVNAFRSRGGAYAQLFILPACGLGFATIADMIFAARRTLDLYQPGDLSDWVRLVGQTLILLFVARAD
jgi:hypothetical protein